MTHIPEDEKAFYKELLKNIINTKIHKLNVIHNRILDYRQKAVNLTLDTAAYAKTEALEGYSMEYYKTYKEVEKLIKEFES